MKDADCPWWAPPLLAVQFLTRLPVPGTTGLSSAQVHSGLVRAVGWFPLVGALVGAVTAAVALGAARWWPVPVAVVAALIVEARLTGAFHEDAVADFCDAFGGGQTSDDVRRIMKDSRIGSYGAVGLGLAIGLRAVLLMAVVGMATPVAAAGIMIASACFGRLLAAVLMAAVPPAAAGTGLAKDIGSGVGGGVIGLAVLTAVPGLAPFAWAAPGPALLTLAASAAFVLWFRAMLLRRIGGSTGDCLGFGAYAGQLLLLLAATAG
ncbi:adenosylcobinamide-GDP ribazoletransferase [Polymorphobacter fuscus]|uniref:Adenosylcobinamide-GDP ribazoletransferase n=1 Tax=Sandarakinorhabdus fusca TaxID=1439888 RepID=A0A7C9GPZ0_9SPHN|nr:adenosylcobinamide-GDP ribazoletransferase [Polymorphobacter fuscus]KAB7648548.1 adenosylcobinamide-GDP ribazoletransferase [Polymorphobacter fuscus]MQT16091.1 adenosylcobinamide-GDP ribazoletransferase [Polymorphobacter fuscus]NJC07630.1 adenosylcobinamide-GDP ribazoletransferase [Polymorphobacter fuscus]